MGDRSFAGQSVIITGASSGIGELLALKLAEQGARLVLAARSEETLESVAERCKKAGGDAIAVKTDVGVLGDCEALVEAACDAWGGVDILVNNAGFSMISRFEDIEDIGIYERLIRVNYLGAVWCTHFALPHLLERSGLIVAVSSLTGKTGVPTRSGYAASKHAMQGFFDSIRIELDGRLDILVVSPGFVETGIRKRAVGADGEKRGTAESTGSDTMTPGYVVAEMVEAMRRGERDLVLPRKMRAGIIAKAIAPKLVDKITARTVRNREDDSE